ncbi:neck protein [uncultured Mediterranean phage]|nr:neck protein [uncultured Mediterranean phage]
MAVNTAFHSGDETTIASERNLYQDLVTEVIQIYGHDVHYVDREAVAEDTFFGEDALSKFQHARKIEMYVEDGDGWRGDDLIMSKFGLQDMSAVTFVVSVPRFQTLSNQIAIESGTDDTGGAILLDSGTIDQSSSSSVLDGDFYLIKDTAPTGLNRPYEGDLIFHPIFKMLFEVKSVEDEEPFYELDNLPVYKMSCQIFDYSSEILDTGVTVIDNIEDNLSTDTLAYQITLEQSSAVNEDIRLETGTDDLDTGLLLEETDGDNIVGESDSTSVGESIILETGEWIIQESYILGQGTRGDDDIDRQAQNELFDQLDDTVLDFTESNPFGDAGSA